MNELIDMKISGASTMPGGEYGRVSISGAGKIKGSVKCTALSCSGSTSIEGNAMCSGSVHASGSAKIAGDVLCAGEMQASGAFRCEGGVQAGSLHCSGATVIIGAAEADEITAAGGTSARGLRCRILKASGGLRVEDGVEAESARLSGSITIPGLLNAERAEIYPSSGSHIGSIGGSDVRILDGGTGRLFGFLPRSGTLITVGTVEADTVELECTEADVVRGRSVRIGKGCRVGRVEYSEKLTAEPGTVGEAVRCE